MSDILHGVLVLLALRLRPGGQPQHNVFLALAVVDHHAVRPDQVSDILIPTVLTNEDDHDLIRAVALPVKSGADSSRTGDEKLLTGFASGKRPDAGLIGVVRPSPPKRSKDASDIHRVDVYAALQKRRYLGEGCVEVEHMVPAIVVVLCSAVVRSVALVPGVFQLAHGCRLLFVELLKESLVDHLAVMSGAAGVDANGSADLFFVACHDVDQIPQGLCGVVSLADVNVDSASSGGAALGSCLPKEADDALQGLDVVVGEDGGDQLAFLIVRPADAHVPLELPNPALMKVCQRGQSASGS